MTGAVLSQPIRGSVAKDGRLVFADDALRRLHHRAGGVEGGPFAIPALAALAALAHALKMRLSRSVKVADVDEDLTLWVDVNVESDLAMLSIVSWRALPTREASGIENAASFDIRSALLFDSQSRLIGATGTIAGEILPADFGCDAEEVLARIGDDGTEISDIAHHIREQSGFSDRNFRTTNGPNLNVSGFNQPTATGEFSAYICRFAEIDEANEAQPSQVQSPGILFGRQLAPVLRQPLGRIIANAETIGSELNGPIRENYALYARDIANAARHLVALVDDLGDLEAVERSDFSVAKDNIEMGDVARRVAGLLALKAADHSIRIVTPTEAQKVPAVAEFRRVLQILLNLVTNAVRYSPDGTEVFIDIATTDDTAIVMVSDQGSGIAIADRQRIFDKFERLGRAGDGGSGLGLYISRKLARAMGGDLTVDSAASGGAKFTLRLPST